MRQDNRKENLSMRRKKAQARKPVSFCVGNLLRAMDESKKEQFRAARISAEKDSKANYNLLGSIKQFI